MSNRHSASLEDYLEAIMMVAGKNDKATVTRISQSMGVKKPSVSSALSKLSELRLVNHERYGEVSLTEKGQAIARDVYHRHHILRRFLVEILSVDEDIAAEDACRMEHYLSSASMNRLDKFIEFVMECPQGRPAWLEGFDFYLKHGHRNPEQLLACSASHDVKGSDTNPEKTK